MATKTITIDMEAYRRLVKARREKDESFSRVIKRLITPPFDLEAYRARLEDVVMSDEAIAAVEQHVAERHRVARRAR